MSDDVSDRRTRELGGAAGAAIFGAASVMELVRMLTRKAPSPGFNAKSDWIISVLAVLLWVTSAYALATRRRNLIIVPVLGAFALFAYGLLGTVGRSSFGIVYVIFGVSMPLLERLAFGGKLSIGRRWTEPPPLPEKPREIL